MKKRDEVGPGGKKGKRGGGNECPGLRGGGEGAYDQGLRKKRVGGPGERKKKGASAIEGGGEKRGKRKVSSGKRKRPFFTREQGGGKGRIWGEWRGKGPHTML